jgi:septum formation protein
MRYRHGAGNDVDSLKLFLASASPRRLDLLRQIGVEPFACLAANIDETPLRNELPRDVAARLACAKALAGVEVARRELAKEGAFLVLGADTVVAVGRRILPKADAQEQAEACLTLLSGRSHRVYTAVCIATSEGLVRQRRVETRVTMKRLSDDERQAYLISGEWQGKAGGYAIQGRAAAFVSRLVGSYSSVVGLPLYETSQMLTGLGYRLRR